MEKDLELSPSPPDYSKDSSSLLSLLFVLAFYSVSCTNTHHDVTDLVNHEMVKNTKT